MKTFKLALGLILPVLVSGCAYLTEAGSKVRLLEGYQAVPSDCTTIGPIKERAFDEKSTELAKIEAGYDIRNIAATKGANVVQIKESSAIIFPKGWTLSGVAYHCEEKTASTKIGADSRKEKCSAKGGMITEGKCVIDI